MLLTAVAVAVVVDSAITLFALGLYPDSAASEPACHPNEDCSFHLAFSFTTFSANLLLLHGYAFTASPWEFLFCLARVIALLFLTVQRLRSGSAGHEELNGRVRDRLNRLGTGLKTAQLVNCAYTVAKFLAFSERSQQLCCAGPWVSCGWNLLSLLLWLLCKLVHS